MIDKQTAIASYTASISTAAGGLLSLNNIALMLGILFAAGTFVVNWYSHAQHIKSERAKRKEDAEYHQARMSALNETSCATEQENEA